MAKRCDICGKGTQFGNTVSKSLNHARRTWKPNVAKVRVRTPDGSVLPCKMCTKCMKKMFNDGSFLKHVRVNKNIVVSQVAGESTTAQ